MKLRKLLLALLLPVLFVGVSLIATNNTFNRGYNVIEVKAATSVDYDNFIEEYDRLREIYPDSICDITYSECNYLLELYNKLSLEEKSDLNEYNRNGKDTFSAAQAITELKKKYYPNKEERDNKGEKISQSTAIIIVVVVSIFGMSAISVLYILKKDKVIE